MNTTAQHRPHSLDTGTPADAIAAMEEQVRRQHQRAQSAFKNGNHAAVIECLQQARPITAAARRLAKKHGIEHAAQHTAWMKNGIASMARILEKRMA